jgi:hypothetical protein
MSEGRPESTDTDPVRTGVDEVDEVLASVEGVDDTDVADHPAVFEAAHDRLRSALDGTS